MEDDDQFLDFYTKIQDIVNSIGGLREEVKDTKVIRKILISLPKRFHPKVMAIEECQDLEKMKIEKLII